MPNELQIVGEARDYLELIDGLRAWFQKLQVTSLSVDAYAGIPDGFFTKAVAAMPISTLGRKTLGPVLGALGLKLIIAVDRPALEKARQRLTPSRFPDRCHTAAVTIRLSEAHLRRIAAKGGQNSRKYMSREAVQQLHSRIGKMGAAARWARRRQTAADRNLASHGSPLAGLNK